MTADGAGNEAGAAQGRPPWLLAGLGKGRKEDGCLPLFGRDELKVPVMKAATMLFLTPVVLHGPNIVFGPGMLIIMLLNPSLLWLWFVEILNLVLLAVASSAIFMFRFPIDDYISMPLVVGTENEFLLLDALTSSLFYAHLILRIALKLLATRAFTTLFAVASVVLYIFYKQRGFVVATTAPAAHLLAESSVHPSKDNPEQPTAAVVAPVATLPLTSARRGGEVGIRGAGFPVLSLPLPITALALPPARQSFVADDMTGLAGGIVNSFAPREHKSEPEQAHEHTDASPISNTEDGDEGEDGPAAMKGELKETRVGETCEGSSGTSSLSTTNDEDASISPNGKLKLKITSWTRGALLGSGSFGSVYQGINDEGVFFAVKEVSLLDEKSVSALEQEIALLSQFEHENIVQYYGSDKDETNLYILMELVTQGSLASLYQKIELQESQVSSYTRQILNGLVYLHERNVIHRDIKCANTLVHASGLVKLADFGLAKEMPKNMQGSCKGTVYWMAPEVVNPKKTYGLSADIWSLGCTVLEMLTRQLPFPGVEWTHAVFIIGRGKQPPIPNKLSKEAQDFIGQCVRVDPEKRPSAAELLKHPFVSRPLRA